MPIALDADSALHANVISAKDLIAAKLASGRAQDLADVQAVKRTPGAETGFLMLV